MKTIHAVVLGILVAAPAGAQTHDVPELGFRFSAPSIYAITQEGITVVAEYADLAESVEFTPFAVNDRTRARTERIESWLTLQDYDFLGAEEVRGDGSVVVTGEGSDGFTLVVVREVWVDSDGGLRIVAYMDPLEPDMVLGIVNSVEITDPAAVMEAGRLAGRID